MFYLDLSCAQIFSRNHYHDLVFELPEHSTLKRFGHLVPNNIPCSTPCYLKFVIIKSIGNEKIPNINVLCTFSARVISILIPKNRTIVVLTQTIILNRIASCCKKIPGPEDIWNEVINTHNLRPRGNICVEILFCGANGWECTSQI